MFQTWQLNWELYRDPFDRCKKSVPSSAASRCSQSSVYSIRNLSCPVELPDIPWTQPERDVTQLQKIWKRLTKLLPWIFKSKAETYY